ncbi:MAG: membrane protein insertion efficiency factor YidD, partial [Candidatus Krumholzibacteria bacterium]|nr:membrane protein insertion efficiency factor YidD [Candidatus Krumholzibacteria bacterium]
GWLLGAWRVLRCGPWSEGGYDPVPGTEDRR